MMMYWQERKKKIIAILSFFYSLSNLFLSPSQTGLSGVRKRRKKRKHAFFLLPPPLPNYLLGPSSFMLLL